jgi:hypothetical protein
MAAEPVAVRAELAEGSGASAQYVTYSFSKNLSSSFLCESLSAMATGLSSPAKPRSQCGR